MRIVVHGQQAFGKAVLEKLLERDENIVAVCTAPDSTAPDRESKPLDPLKALALANNLPVHQPVSWKTDEALTLMRSFEADICMMVYVLLFVPQPVLDAPKLGSFQYHPSLLPLHRGPSSINWPIAQGDNKTGLTIFWPNEGLDEGPVLLQKTCVIGPDETLGDVYFKKLFPMGVDAMLESLDLVKAGKAPRVAQDLSAGSYESWFGKKEAELDWSRSAAELYNVVRAANPQPGAWTTHKGGEVKFFDAALATGTGKPGEVISIDDESFVVAASTGAVRVRRVRASAGKVSAPEFVATSGLVTGDRFG